MTGLATLSQNNNAFTFTPSTDAADQGQSFTATFSVTDGINTAVSNQATFTIGIDQLAEPSVGTLTITSPTGQAVFISGLSALWKDVNLSIGTSSTNGLDNSTFIDRSTNAHTVTPTGDPAQTAFHPYLENWSVEFEPADYLSSSSDTSIQLGSSDFTIEAWIYVTQYGSSLTGISSSYSSSGDQRGWIFGVRSDEIELLMSSDGTAGGLEYLTHSATISLNTWYWVAVTRSGSTFSFYVDGTRVGVSTSSSTIFASSAAHLIGDGNGAATDSRFGGYISNYRLLKGEALYTASSVTPPTEKLTVVSGTELLACQSNRFIDNSTNAHAITVAGNPVVSAFNPFGQESEYAAGENRGSTYLKPSGTDEVVITHNASMNAGAGDFCLQLWVNGDPSVNTGFRGLAAKYAGGAGSIWIQLSNGVPIVGFSTSVQGTATTNILDNTWHHVAFTRSSGAVRLFIDGVEEISYTDGQTLNTAADFIIGDIYSLNRNLKGYVSDFKYDSANATYTANFTPPTAPVGNTNASIYLPFDNAGVFDKTGNNALTLVGNTSTSTTQTKYADTAMYFDGSGDAVLVPQNNTLNFGTGDFTVEGWFWTDSAKTSTITFPAYFGNFGDLNPAFGFSIYQNLWRIVYKASQTSNTYYGSTSVTYDSWQHVAITRSGTTMSIWVDGSLSGSFTNSADFASSGGLTIGSGDSSTSGWGTPDYFTQGYIENFQILKGVAKYTSNFTVPDREQGRNYQAES